MGSYNIACQISHAPIGYEDEAVLVFVRKNRFKHKSTTTYVTDEYAPVSLPFFVTYRDYGQFALDDTRYTQNKIAWEMLHLAASGAALPMAIDEHMIEVAEQSKKMHDILSNQLYKDENLAFFEDFDFKSFSDIFEKLNRGDDSLGYMVFERNMFETLVSSKFKPDTLANFVKAYEDYNPSAFTAFNFEEPTDQPLRSIGAVDAVGENQSRFFYVLLDYYMSEHPDTIAVFVIARMFYEVMTELAIPYAKRVYAGEDLNENLRSAKMIAELERFKADFPEFEMDYFRFW